MKTPRGNPLAVTSRLWPCSLAENLRRISEWDLPIRPIREVGLLFYETETSLAYPLETFAPLAGLSSHAHLPMDLPWEAGAHAVWDILRRLMEKPAEGAFCKPWGGVLHPPEDPGLLAGVAELWRKAAPGWRLMVENIPTQDLRAHWPVIVEMDLAVCLDVGHLIAFGQEWLLHEPDLPNRVTLVHCYAPGERPNYHVHLPLSELTPAQAPLVRRILDMVSPAVPILFEIFSYEHLLASLERFYQLDEQEEKYE